MILSRPARFVIPAAAFALAFLIAAIGPGSVEAQQEKKKTQPKKPALDVDPEQVLKAKPRPKRPDLPASKLPLEFIKGERIALVGNSTAERMNLFGHFEAHLHTRFPDKELIFRNFGFPADEVSVRQRSSDYTNLDDPLSAFGADTYLCFFGFNESFKGPDGIEKFKEDYEKFLDLYASKYPRDDAKSPPRFVLVTPIAFEPTENAWLPIAKDRNPNLRLYADAVKAVAAKRKLAVVDLFNSTEPLFSQEAGAQFTINGCHLNERGDQLVGGLLDEALFGQRAAAPETARFEKLRAAVNDKSWVHQQDYRMVNGWYVYGGRRTFDTETFPREYAKIRNMAAVRDQYVWDIAAGKPVAEKPDDSKTGDLIVPPTRFGEPRQKYSEDAESPRILAPDDFLKTVTTPPGTAIKLFADETMFPELAKPVQLNFDNKGRLWVSCMPNYPQWKPGDPPANDKLLILEDADGDGKADKCKVFYDKLHCPTGFEFFAGGVLVMSQPRILWLKDTDGDDKADVVVHLIDGWATDDTHHRGGFEWSHGGVLHLLEGIATSTTLETPWGPHRSRGTGGAYQIDPISLQVRQFALPGMANMWCYHFDEWGQGFVGDGTTPNQAWDTPLSGAQFSGRKGMNFLFPDDKGERPNLGSERLVSRYLPDEMQGQFVYATVITMNGLPRFRLRDDGAGYTGRRVKDADGGWSDLVRSTDKHFRPADPQIGPDGALWFGDWANPLIGHMQYSQRDPNRDHTRGRVYRLVGTRKQPVKPVTQDGKSIAEILEQFREYEWRTRYRARRELRARPAADVLRAVSEWMDRLDKNDKDYDRLVCEGLWVQQGHHAVDPGRLERALFSINPNARAAGVRIMADERERLGGAFTTFQKMASDEHPRVRAEAIRALSFYSTSDAIAALLESAKKPLDYWTRYTLESALGANEAAWRQGYTTGTLAKDNPAGRAVMKSVIASSDAGRAAEPFIQTLLSLEPRSAEERNKALTALAMLPGKASNGREVFIRNCTACHKVGNGEGQEYGPNMTGVATRLKTRYKLVESVIDPNADVDPKYLSTKIEMADGTTVTGLLVSEDKKTLVIFDGKEKKTLAVGDIVERKTLKQSSMPDGQVANMNYGEFLDLIEYLAGQK